MQFTAPRHMTGRVPGARRPLALAGALSLAAGLALGFAASHAASVPDTPQTQTQAPAPTQTQAPGPAPAPTQTQAPAPAPAPTQTKESEAAQAIPAEETGAAAPEPSEEARIVDAVAVAAREGGWGRHAALCLSYRHLDHPTREQLAACAVPEEAFQ